MKNLSAVVSLNSTAKEFSPTNSRDTATDNLLTKLREELVSRGASGIIGIQRKFRIIDDDGDKALSIGEFTKALKESKLNLSTDVNDFRLRQIIDMNLKELEFLFSSLHIF